MLLLCLLTGFLLEETNINGCRVRSPARSGGMAQKAVPPEEWPGQLDRSLTGSRWKPFVVIITEARLFWVERGHGDSTRKRLLPAGDDGEAIDPQDLPDVRRGNDLPQALRKSPQIGIVEHKTGDIVIVQRSLPVRGGRC